MRAAGVLLPVASLPTPYGIGGFSREAYDFVDSLAEAGQRYWQILPLGPTGYGDSPYQSFSTFAGNPYFISLDLLAGEGLLTKADLLAADCGKNPRSVDYEKIYRTRFIVLHRAFARWQARGGEREKRFEKFCRDNADWLPDYCLYTAIKKEQGEKSWQEWPVDLRNRDPDALQRESRSLSTEILFTEFIQFKFSVQWAELKSYANRHGVQIIGDVPIYVAMDSADTWANRELFQFTEKFEPKGVAGCPPDAFSADGQLWGNPLYDWEKNRSTGYDWWIRRVKKCMELYDVVRIDHFRGFESYYSIPYGDRTARRGHWEKGPGLELFRSINNALGSPRFIAEDLGFLTDSVRSMVRESGYPGMKVLQFAFGTGAGNEYLPHWYDPHCVVYTGTHDNNTTKGWLSALGDDALEEVRAYVDDSGGTADDLTDDLVRLALASVARTAVIPLQDYLHIGSEGRINFPSTLGTNWKWRLLPGEFSEKHIRRIRQWTELYGRLPEDRN